MKILCLCPTYGRHQELIENTLACFYKQTHKDKFLLMFDDLGTVGNHQDQQHLIVSTTIRQPHLPAKYHEMLSVARQNGIGYDAVAVWDDDDVYLPNHLAHHARVLASRLWSKSKQVWSTYGGVPHLEDATGRFHGSVAVTRTMLEVVGGWRQDGRADFDQDFIGRCAKVEMAGDPTGICMADPQYVFRWEQTKATHCQGLMSSPDNQDWYERLQPGHTVEFRSDLTPLLDPHAAQLYRDLT